MEKNKITIKHTPSVFQIEKNSLIIGIVFGLFFAFSFYAFMYMSRESMRIMSITPEYDLWALTDKEVHFYNFIFALIAVITALSIVFTFWIDRPKKLFAKRNYIRASILNDQRFMTWGFLSWFSKAAFLFGLFYGDVFNGGFYVFGLYPEYIYLFIFFIVVIYLHLWMAIRLKMRGSFKWMLSTAAIITALSFGLSKINFIDYKAFNDRYLEKNVFHKYNLELPKSKVLERLDQRSLIEWVHIVKDSNNRPSIIHYTDQIYLNEIPLKVHERMERLPFNLRKRFFCQLTIDKNIEMEFVNKVKDELSKSGVVNIGYAIVPANSIYDQKFYRNYTFKMWLPPKEFNLPYPAPPSLYEYHLNDFENIIKLSADNFGYLYINDVLTKDSEIKNTVQSLIQQNSDYAITLETQNNMKFSTYFKLLSNAKDAVYELRDDYSMEYFGKHYNDDIPKVERDEIRRKYPFSFIEINP